MIPTEKVNVRTYYLPTFSTYALVASIDKEYIDWSCRISEYLTSLLVKSLQMTNEYTIQRP